MKENGAWKMENGAWSKEHGFDHFGNSEASFVSCGFEYAGAPHVSAAAEPTLFCFFPAAGSEATAGET